MTKQTDRIEGAAGLIKLNAIVKEKGQWLAINAKLNTYNVTRESCTCPDCQIRNAPRREVQALCKHQLATFGSSVVLFVCDLRKAETRAELLAVVRQYAEAVKLALPEYHAIAAHEYRLAVERVKDKDAEKESEEMVIEHGYVPEDTAAILRKEGVWKQYNGIDI